MTIVFSIPGNEVLANSIATTANYTTGKAIIRTFPDQESYVRLISKVTGQKVIIVCSLDRPNDKIMPLLFLAKTAKEMGAQEVTLIAPYLGYMRQDKRFHEGEAISSKIFAEIISKYLDYIVTIDPHLHRYKTLSEIYSISTTVLSATNKISEWIKTNIENPILIGPDQESGQWISSIAEKIDVPFRILRKIRHGDSEVEVSVPQLQEYQNHNPVLVDDIISTGRTMIETVTHLNNLNMKATTCIGVHGVFASRAFEQLQQAGVAQIVTCNTISHPSNAIDISGLIIDCLKD